MVARQNSATPGFVCFPQLRRRAAEAGRKVGFARIHFGSRGLFHIGGWTRHMSHRASPDTRHLGPLTWVRRNTGNRAVDSHHSKRRCEAVWAKKRGSEGKCNPALGAGGFCCGCGCLLLCCCYLGGAIAGRDDHDPSWVPNIRDPKMDGFLFGCPQRNPHNGGSIPNKPAGYQRTGQRILRAFTLWVPGGVEREEEPFKDGGLLGLLGFLLICFPFFCLPCFSSLIVFFLLLSFPLLLVVFWSHQSLKVVFGCWFGTGPNLHFPGL